MEKGWHRHSALLKLTGLVAILLIAYCLGTQPHRNYGYPLHVDEWFAIGYTQNMLEEGSLTYQHPYSGSNHVIENNSEMGFHLLIGFSKDITGLSWMELYRLATGCLFVLLAFLVYAVGRSEGFGWAAALLVPLIPTSVRTLGPAFLVPVAVSLLFVPVTILLLQRLEVNNVGKGLWLLLIVIGGSILVYPPVEIVLTVLAVLYLVAIVAETISTRQYMTSGKILIGIVIRVTLPLVILWQWIPSTAKDTFAESISHGSGSSSHIIEALGYNKGFLEAFGFIGVGLFIFGFFMYLFKRSYGLRTFALPVCCVILLCFLYAIYPKYEVGPDILYERGWSYIALLMVILAGYGVGKCVQYITMRNERSVFTFQRHSGWMIRGAVIVIVGVLIIALMTGYKSDRREEYASYYHMVNDEIYADILWIGEEATIGEKVVVMEPSLAWVYPPIAGPGNRVTSAMSWPRRAEWGDKVYEMFETGKADVDWLNKRNTTVIYTRLPGTGKLVTMSDTNLIKVRPGVNLVLSN